MTYQDHATFAEFLCGLLGLLDNTTWGYATHCRTPARGYSFSKWDGYNYVNHFDDERFFYAL